MRFAVVLCEVFVEEVDVLAEAAGVRGRALLVGFFVPLPVIFFAEAFAAGCAPVSGLFLRTTASLCSGDASLEGLFVGELAMWSALGWWGGKG
jgi:hypothetical protein